MDTAHSRDSESIQRLDLNFQLLDFQTVVQMYYAILNGIGYYKLKYQELTNSESIGS